MYMVVEGIGTGNYGEAALGALFTAALFVPGGGLARAGAKGLEGAAADSVVQVSRTAEGAAEGSGISLSAARAAAERNGIDTRLMDLSYETGSPGQYGFTSFNGAGNLIRGATGRFQVTLTDLGLRSEADSVNTIAHELNHIREGMRTGGLPPSEGPAIWSGDTAELFFR